VKSIYIRGVPATITEAAMKELFGKHGEIEKVVLPSAPARGGPVRDFAFVHYKERLVALAAAKVTHPYSRSCMLITDRQDTEILDSPTVVRVLYT
jgi:RNA recognition motif-containing protein